jgi:hypothetical protein
VGSATQSLELASDAGKPGLPGSMSGQVQANPANHYYGFVPQDAVAFDTVPSGQPDRGNTISIGGKTYTGTLPAGATAGFHALALDARTLKLIEEHVYAAPGGENDFLTWITNQANSGARPLVVVQSIGSPKPGTDPKWNDIGNRIEQLGGTAAVFNGLNGTGGYSLVGRAGVGALAEASTVVTGQPGRLVGDLSRSSDFGYQPLLFGPEAQPSQELLAIASQAPTDWPAINAAANAYITNALGFAETDLRQLFYADYNTPAVWSKRSADIGKVSYPGDGHGFSNGEFKAAQDELADEVGAVVEVENYIERLRAPFTDGTPEHVSLQQISVDIQKVFTPKPGFDASPAFQIMSKLFTLAAGEFKIPELKVAGQVAGAMSYLNKLPLPKGDPILGKLQTATDKLGSDLDLRYAAARQAMTQLGLILVSDYGKLSNVGGSILHHISARVKSATWRLPAEPDAVKTPLIKASQQVFFGTLMRTAWDVWDIPGVGNARDWYCMHTIPIVKPKRVVKHFTWRDVSDAGQYTVTKGFGAGGARQNVQRALGIPKAELDLANPPPDKLVKPLFSAVDQDPNSNNLGLYKPWFYRDFARHNTTIALGGKC